MKVADTMLANYASSIAGIPVENWTVQCGQVTETDVKSTYKSDENRPDSVIVCLSGSSFLPMLMKTAFDLLKNHLLRPKVCWSLPAITWQQHDLRSRPL
jgi:homeobox-leucine zipper protein